MRERRGGEVGWGERGWWEGREGRWGEVRDEEWLGERKAVEVGWGREGEEWRQSEEEGREREGWVGVREGWYSYRVGRGGGGQG